MGAWVSAIGSGLVGFLLDLAPALLGTLVGAWLAFRFESVRSENADRQRRRVAGNRALFVLGSQISALRNIRDQVLNPVRQLADREFAIQHLVGGDSGLYLELSELLFLLEAPAQNMLMELFNAEKWYRTAMNALDERNRVQREFATALGAQGVAVPMTAAQIRERVPPNILVGLKSLTNALYVAVDEGLPVMESTASILESSMRALFPGEKVATLNPIDRVNAKAAATEPPSPS